MASLTTSHILADKFCFNSNVFFAKREKFCYNTNLVCYCCVSFVSFGKSNFYWIVFISIIVEFLYLLQVYLANFEWQQSYFSCLLAVAVELLFISTASGSRGAFHVYCQWQQTWFSCLLPLLSGGRSGSRNGSRFSKWQQKS